jgi:hypothetical protein
LVRFEKVAAAKRSNNKGALRLDVLGADAEAYEAGHGAAEDWEWRENPER